MKRNGKTGHGTTHGDRWALAKAREQLIAERRLCYERIKEIDAEIRKLRAGR